MTSSAAMTRGPRPADNQWTTIAFGVGAVAVSFLIYALASLRFDAGRPDFFYLADAFLHGRFWLDRPFGPWDNVIVDCRVYVPFAPFPAIAFAPLVALIGPVTADRWEQVIDSAIAAIDVGLCWWLMGRLGVRTVVERIWLVFLLGFSTQILWVTTRGGVWHTGHLIAMALTLAGLLESFGRRRPWLLGLVVGAAFLTRAPVALAAPFFAWVLADREVSGPSFRPPGRGGRGWSTGSGSHRRSRSRCGTTRHASGHHSSRATRWRRSLGSWRPSAPRVCSRSATWMRTWTTCSSTCRASS